MWNDVVGLSFTSQGRTFTDAEIALMTDLTWTGHDLHANAVAMREHPAGDRMLAGPAVLACALGQIASAGWEAVVAGRYGVRPLGLLATEDVRFTSPIVPGSTMVVTTEVVSARASESRDGCGVVTTNIRGVDAERRDELFVQATEVSLWTLRD